MVCALGIPGIRKPLRGDFHDDVTIVAHKSVFTWQTSPRTNSYKIGYISSSAVRNLLCFRRKKHANLKNLSADRRNVSGDKFAELWTVVNSVGKRHEIGPCAC